MIGISGPTTSRTAVISGPSPSSLCSSAIAPWMPSSTPSTGIACANPVDDLVAHRLERLAETRPPGTACP